MLYSLVFQKIILILISCLICLFINSSFISLSLYVCLYLSLFYLPPCLCVSMCFCVCVAHMSGNTCLACVEINRQFSRVGYHLDLVDTEYHLYICCVVYCRLAGSHSVDSPVFNCFLWKVCYGYQCAGPLFMEGLRTELIAKRS